MYFLSQIFHEIVSGKKKQNAMQVVSLQDLTLIL